MTDAFFNNQILTYMGNKRKFISSITRIIEQIKKKCKKEKLEIAEGFSGTGIISRLFKENASNLYVNDLAGYSQTLSQCYLATPTGEEREFIQYYIEDANRFVDSPDIMVPLWMRKHWSPKDENNIHLFGRLLQF